MANLINDKERHCKKVTIIDDCMGSGKTSWAIQYINEAPNNKKFIFITPFIDEVDRVIKETKNRRFRQPLDTNGTKLQDLKRLLEKGSDVATTHSLFKNFDDEVLLLLRINHYVLIMDEVMNVIEQIKITKDDIEILLNSNLITVDEKKEVLWIPEDYEGKFFHIKNMCHNEKLFIHNKTALIWTFPIEVLEQFSEVLILTYMFDCQIQRYYFDWNQIQWEKKSVEKIGEQFDGDKMVNIYALTDYIRRSATPYKPLINMYQGQMNSNWKPKKRNISNGYDALTHSQLIKLTKRSPVRNKMKTNLESFFKQYGTTTNDNMWTCPIDAESILKGKKYSGSSKNKCFVASNARATNNFGHKSTLAYVLNKYMSPTIVDFFKDYGIVIDQDTYALSELLQWLFRSRIRKGEPIELFIPSLRMRTLLQQWLNDEPIQW